ncbi:response regulator [Fibrella aestuarina]|uniref:histidine kinase n=2 Tax=Fibrivirga algicola TaxID=2950420 RepID=A0ABX0QP63_9BACT|nr:response regulator [Fibrivirga algicola]
MRFLYLLILMPFTLVAQPKGWQELTISDGLSQGMIFGLKQDRKGFIWIATKDGLNRYDGYNFTVFSHDPYNPFSLSDNSCSSLLIDSHNRVWVGTIDNGLNLFDERTQRFYHIAISDRSAPDAGNYEIWLLTEDPEGNIWVGTDKNKVFKVSLPKSLDTQFPEQPNFTEQTRQIHISFPETRLKDKSLPSYISFHPNGQAFLGTTNGIYAFNWKRPTTATKVSLAEREDVHSMYEDPQNEYRFVTNSDQIIGWYKGNRKTIRLPTENNFNVQLKPIDKKTVAIATPDLLWLLSPAELYALDSLTARNAFVSLPPNVYSITNLLKDKTDNIWVGTSGYGLRKFNPSIKQFHHYLPNVSLSSLYSDRRGRTYARFQFAYGLFDPATNQLRPFLDDKLPPADKRQRHMIQSRTGDFWVSNVDFETHNQFLIHFSEDWRLLKKYPLPATTSFGFYGNQSYEDGEGNLWLGATNGQLVRFDPKKEAFRVFSYQSLLPRSGAEIETYAMHRDRLGTLWIGTQKGLVKVKNLQTAPTFSIYKNSATDRTSLSNDFVLSVTDDPHYPDRYLWVATKGGGLERLDKQAGTFTHFTEAQGLPNKVVYGILTDEYKNLWLSTNRGLAQFNPKTLVFRQYTRADGLQDDEFNTSSFCRSTSGELLFGGVNGLTSFRASDVATRLAKLPTVAIIGLKVNNRVVTPGDPSDMLAQSIEYTNALKLAYNQNLLTLEFAALDFTNPAKNRYRYQMEGIDQDWVEAGTNRFANYAQLPDGQYTFRVMGSADGQTWSAPAELQIRIYPPVYRSWWAYLLYAGLLAFVGWQVYRFKTQRWMLQQRLLFEQQEAVRLAELDTLKTQFFTTISHEFRTPLTLILGPLTDLKRRLVSEPVVTLSEPIVALMERNGSRLLSLINQLLDLSKLEAGQLAAEPERGNMAVFFQTLANSFTVLAESRQIHFSFTQTTTERWADFDRDKVEKIVTNLLANAFKFTPAGGHVRMSVQYAEPATLGTIRLCVEDTGIGIAAENLAHIFERFYQVDGRANRLHEGTGIGLALVNELVRVLGGRIEVASTTGVGTTFTLQLPVTMVDPLGDEGVADLPENVPAVTLGTLLPDAGAAEPATSPLAAAEQVLLVIDDNADIRAYIRQIFEADYQVVEAEDGREGLDKALALLPSLVICDLMMPRFDGFAFCRMLKSEEATSHIPVVMLTAKTTVESRIEGYEQGADDYLTKPFNQAEIQARVRNLIQQRQRLYAWFSTHLKSPARTELVTPTPLTAEQRFIDRLTAIVQAHLDDTNFSVEALAEAANLSRMQLHRKIKALTNSNATNFIRDIRLATAARLLRTGDQSVTQVAYAVGFDNLSYFAKVFQEQYGVLPSQYSKTEAPV